MSNIDWVALDGKVHDPQRIDYLHRHLQELKRACVDGVDVAGYFQWCFTDNFEWEEGFWPRFGLIEIDRDNLLRRKIRGSALKFAEICKNNYLEY